MPTKNLKNVALPLRVCESMYAALQTWTRSSSRSNSLGRGRLIAWPSSNLLLTGKYRHESRFTTATTAIFTSPYTPCRTCCRRTSRWSRYKPFCCAHGYNTQDEQLCFAFFRPLRRLEQFSDYSRSSRSISAGRLKDRQTATTSPIPP